PSFEIQRSPSGSSGRWWRSCSSDVIESVRSQMRMRAITPSHAEDAERRFGNRGVVRGGEAEREHAPRVERVDDPVVPEACGRVVRVALRLVLRADLVLVDLADHLQDGRGLFAA